MRRYASLWFPTVVAVVVASCGVDPTSEPTPAAPTPTADAGEPASSTSVEPPSASSTTAPGGVQACADVIDATIAELSDGSYRFDATVRSGDTGWDKYADAWEVRHPDGTMLGVRVLAHPHETEQPFTRSLSPVVIPPDVDQVVIAAQDSVNGFCGETLTLDVPR